MERIGEEQKMSVKEVAEAIGTAESTIRNKVKELFPEIVENGKATMITERQAHAIKSSIVPRDLTLKSKLENATTALDIEEMTIKVIQYHIAEAARLRAENEVLKPKADFYDSIIDSRDAIDMRNVAAVLNCNGWGRNKIFQLLRDKKILDGDNVPYRQYQDNGYFRVIETKFTDKYGEIHINVKTLVYQKGVDFIRKIIGSK